MHKLLSSYLITAFCGWAAAFLLPLVIQEITHSAFYTSIAYTISVLPYLFIMPLAGVIGDHFDKKKIIQIGEVANVLLVIGLIVTPFQTSYLNMILFLHFGLSAVVAVHHTIFQAVVPEMVAKNKISKFNSYASAINNVIALVAPALVGIWLSVGSTKTLLYYLVGGYFISLVVITIIPYTHRKNPANLQFPSIFSSLKEGVHYLQDQTFLKYAVINFFFVNFGETFINSNLVHYLKHHHEINESELSYYFIPMGVGALLGSIVAPSIMSRVAPGKIILYGSAFSAISASMIFVNHTPWMTTSLWGLNEASASVVIVTFCTLRQRLVPVYLLSRIVAVTRMTAYLAMPLASMSSGWLFEYTNHFPYLLVISILSIVIGIMVSSRELLHSDITHHSTHEVSGEGKRKS